MLFTDHSLDNLAGFYRDGLINDPPLVRVIAHFNVATQREVLAEGVADEPVIGKNPS